MAKYTGADCKICRREGCKLFLKGERCLTKKCAFERRPNVPGVHGAARKKITEYGLQLREKQKVKRAYGLQEKQFRSYYEKANTMRGKVGENMLSLLERRLDNVVYRMGIGASRAESRQIVNHGHITVNGSRVNIPSYLVKAGDIIAVKENKVDKTLFADIKAGKTENLPSWLEFDNATLSGKVLELPTREGLDIAVEEHLIVELYSK